MHALRNFCYSNRTHEEENIEKTKNVLTFLLQNIKTIELSTIIIKQRERLRNFTILHFCLKMQILPQELLIISHYRSIVDEIVANYTVYQNYNLKKNFYFSIANIDIEENKVNFLNYCQVFIFGNYSNDIIFISRLMKLLITHYKEEEISKTLEITYLVFKYRYHDTFSKNWKYLKRYVTKIGLITTNPVDSEDAFSLLLNVNTPEDRIYAIYSERNFDDFERNRYENIMLDSIRLLNQRKNGIEIGHELWDKVFRYMSYAIAHHEPLQQLNVIIEIINIWFRYIKRDIEIHYQYFSKNNNYFDFYTNRGKKYIMRSIFEIMFTAVKFYDCHPRAKELLDNGFRDVLILLLQCNKNSDFDIVFEFMLYVANQKHKILKSLDKFNRVMTILNKLKLFRISINCINNSSAFTISANNILISTSFELALYIVTHYELNIVEFTQRSNNRNEEIIPSNKHNDLIQFFIDNNNDNAICVNTRCANFFFDNFSFTFKNLLPIINLKRKENGLKLKFIAAKSIKKHNIDYSCLKTIIPLKNLVTYL